MTEEEIIKEWKEVLSYAEHHELNLMDSVPTPLIRETVEMLERQQAEIEILESHSGKCIYLSDDSVTNYCVEAICPKFKTEKQIKARAIKVFAERLKKELGFGRYTSYKDIDNLVEEMVGANNDR